MPKIAVVCYEGIESRPMISYSTSYTLNYRFSYIETLFLSRIEPNECPAPLFSFCFFTCLINCHCLARPKTILIKNLVVDDGLRYCCIYLRLPLLVPLCLKFLLAVYRPRDLTVNGLPPLSRRLNLLVF